MPRIGALVVAMLLATLLIAGCGGGSSPSGKEVAEHVRGHGVYGAECVKAGNRAYHCTALTEKSKVPVKLDVTVGQSGRPVYVTHCEAARKPARGEPCSKVN